jgi:hypothetical protein
MLSRDFQTEHFPMKTICMFVLALALVAVAGAGCRGEVEVDDQATIAQPQ